MSSKICMAIFGLIMAISCSHQTKEGSQVAGTETSEEEMTFEGSHYTKLDFPPGSSELDEDDKQSLQALTEIAKRDGRPIFDIKVLSWADKDYKETNESVDKNEIGIAQKRAEAIRKYLRSDLETHEDLQIYNMAKKPNTLTKLLKTDDYKLKKAFEDKSSDSLSASASEALIIIEYDEDEEAQNKKI